MIIKSDKIAEILQQSKDDPEFEHPLSIIPTPNLKLLTQSGAASVDLRLGTWFITPRQARLSHLDIVGGKTTQAEITKTNFVPFGGAYFLHPRSFVLGITMEWLRMPSNLAGYIVGKSSWGRCGLIIETAAGIHPGFTGCLTLELTNTGEVPIRIIPGMTICQLFLHEVRTEDEKSKDKSRFVGQRQPILGKIELDKVAKKLSKAYKTNK